DLAYTTMPFMDIQTLHTLARSSTDMRKWVHGFLETEYNNDLSAYVAHPSALRAVLRLLHAVISGSFALAFLLRNNEPKIIARDLDIYVPHKYAKRLARYLTAGEGYSVVLSHHHRYDGNAAIASVQVLAKGAMRIEIIESTTSSALFPLPHFWATHVVNYLTADTFCIAYPSHTLKHEALFN
ncbi:hypothetical protein FKP32DRAFT_1553809, partial [Trametes sanguinea]